MKKINFINATTSWEHLHFVQWKKITIILMAVVIVILGSFELYRLSRLYSLQKTHAIMFKKIEKELHHYEQCIALEQQIQNQQNLITALKSHNHNPLEILQLLRNLKSVILEQYTITNNIIELQLIVPNKTVEKNIIKLLEQSPLVQNCTLVSIAQKTKENQLLTFKATLKA